MAEKVKLSKDGSAIDFVQTDNIPTSLKKFRQSPEIEGFYRFIYENDLQKEAFEILDRIVTGRKVAKKALKQEAAQTKKNEQAEAKEQAKQAATLEKTSAKIEKSDFKNTKKEVLPLKTMKTTPAKPAAPLKAMKPSKGPVVTKAKIPAKAAPKNQPKAKGKKK